MSASRGPSSTGPVTDQAFQVVGDTAVRLEDVVDRDALTEVCKSIHSLFGIGVRVYSHEGALLGGAAAELETCTFVNQIAAGRVACASTVTAAKSVEPGDGGDVLHACFTGLTYRIVSLDYETRSVGRIVLGPYAPAGLKDAPPDLEKAVPKLDVLQTNTLLAKVPRVKSETLSRIAAHLKTTLELIIFSSHKAYVTSKLHLYSVRQSYRELEEKTQRLEQALVKLKEADRLKSNFLATVSHELRTPLTSIIGYSEMLAEGIAGKLSEEQSEFVKTIHGKGGQLLGLITGLLDLSKLDSGTMTLRASAIEISPVLSDVVKTLTPAAMKKGVALVLDDDVEGCDLSGDPERLRQVFVNLVDNAVKFTPKGGSVTVRARVVEGGTDDDDDSTAAVLFAPLLRQIEIRVADTGIGIPAHERSKVFDAFYQVDSSSTREFGGTGLGLSIVKRIVEAHGGKVTIEANDPTGAVFFVSLPSAQAQRVLPSRVPPAAGP